MAISIGNIRVDAYILPPECDLEYRARSVRYALNGNVHEDRLGQPKKQLVMSFPSCPSNIWEALKTKLQEDQITVSGSVGTMSVAGTYHLKDNVIPTPTLVVINGIYYCSVSIALEEV